MELAIELHPDKQWMMELGPFPIANQFTLMVL